MIRLVLEQDDLKIPQEVTQRQAHVRLASSELGISHETAVYNNYSNY